MNPITITNTLLENIPSELLAIINFNIDKIIIKRNEKIIESHKHFSFQTHILCHICKLNEAIFFLDKEPISADFSKHPCCLDCVQQKKYIKGNLNRDRDSNCPRNECGECNTVMQQLHQDIKMHYLEGAKNDIDLLIKLERCWENNSGHFDHCPLCFPYNEYYEQKNCISCGTINNLIKCYHETIHGKRIIYICDDGYCSLNFYYDMIKVKNNNKWGRIDVCRFLSKI